MSKLIPNTLFMRLFLLLAITLSISHLLGMALVSNIREVAGVQWQRGMPPPPMQSENHRGQMSTPPLPASPGMQPRGPRKPPVSFLMLDLALRIAGLLLVSLIGARWLSAPIHRLAQAAHAFGKNIDAPALDESGTVEIRQAAQALNDMRERLRRQINERSGFLAAISHDLRTPLTRMQLRAESIEPETLQQKFRGDIAEMSSMLTAALEYLRGHMDREEMCVTDVVSMVQAMAEDLQEQGHAVTVRGHVEPIKVKPMAIRRCLGNLIQNAIKYGERADISLQELPDKLIIEIQDAGPGIDIQRLDDVFQPFYRLEASRNRATGGVGLGLTIARDIARAHGGDLTLHNAKPIGLIARLEIAKTL